MALDVFSILAMLDEPERVFSLTGLITKLERGRLSAQSIAYR